MRGRRVHSRKAMLRQRSHIATSRSGMLTFLQANTITCRHTTSDNVPPCRKYDYDNYVWMLKVSQVHIPGAQGSYMHNSDCIATFLHAQELRAALLALRCFNIETGLVGETVKETGLLPIRMQWWRDAVNSIYRDKPTKHPAVQALAQAR